MAGARSRDWEAVERLSRSLGFVIAAPERERIDQYIELLCLWNQRLRLTGEQDPSLLLTRHVADSLACVPLLPTAGSVLDLGTGAGFPGAVLACVRPDLPVLLLDSRERPIAFLREAIRAIGLGRVKPILMRAEEAARDPEIAGQQRMVVSRAVRMREVVAVVATLLARGGLYVSMQTRKVSWETATRAVDSCSLELAAILDYDLPDGDPRRLVVWRR